MGLNQGAGGAGYLLEAVSENVFPCLFHPSEATHIRWFVVPSSILKTSKSAVP